MSAAEDLRANFSGSSVEWLKARIKEYKLNESRLTKKINQHSTDRFYESTIRRILKRKTETPNLETLEAIAGGLSQVIKKSSEQILDEWLAFTKKRNADEILKEKTLPVKNAQDVDSCLKTGLRAHSLPPETIVGLRFADVDDDSFKDREHEIKELRRLLGDPRAKFTCIVGRAGIGKTALLSQVCAEIERGELSLPNAQGGMSVNGIIYVSDNPTVERLFRDFGQMLDSAEAFHQHWHDVSRSLADRAHFLLSQLREGCYLLVLDNFEDALTLDGSIADADLAAFFDVFLSTPHHLRILATSRNPVAMKSQGIRVTRGVSITSGLPEADAIMFLRDLDHDGELGIRDAPDDILRSAVQRCSGLPRALEAIVGLLFSDPTLTLEQLLANEKLFSEQVMENLVAELYHRVSDDQQRVLEALAVYAKPTTDSAVRDLLRPFFPKLSVNDCLRVLVRNYLVSHRRGQNIYSLHSLDQQYAYAHIPEGDGNYTKRALHLRAAEVYFDLAERDTVQKMEFMSAAWEHRLKAGEEEMCRCLEAEAAQLASVSLAGEGDRALKQLLSGYIVWVQNKEIRHPSVMRTIADCVPQLLSAEHHEQELLLTLARSQHQLYQKTYNNENHAFLPDLREICRACALCCRELDPTRELWFGFQTVKIASFLKERGYSLNQQEIVYLVTWLEKVAKERQLEGISIALAGLDQFLPAARTAFQLAQHVKSENTLPSKVAIPYSAAFFSFAAECFTRAGSRCDAAKAYIDAADLLSRQGRLSMRALKHYNTALELGASCCERNRVEKMASHLDTRLQEIDSSRLATVVIVGNLNNMDYGDILVEPLAKCRIVCGFKLPAEVSDLADLTDYNGSIILGGPGARGTDRYLREYFYEIPSLREGKTIKEIDDPSLSTRFCDFWYRDLAGKPSYVLAGYSARLTCQAVIEFVESEEFKNLVSLLTKT